MRNNNKTMIAIADLQGMLTSPPIGTLSLHQALNSQGYEVEYYDLSQEIISFLMVHEDFIRLKPKLLNLIHKNIHKPLDYVAFLIIKATLKRIDNLMQNHKTKETRRDLWYLYSLIFGHDKEPWIWDRSYNKPVINNNLETYILKHLIINGFPRLCQNLLFNDYQFIKYIQNKFSKCSVVALASNRTPVWEPLLKISSIIKESYPEKIIVAGGHCISSQKTKKSILKENFKTLNYLITGEGEESFPQLINYLHENLKIENVSNLMYLKNNAVKTNKNTNIKSLNELPIPSYEVYLKKYPIELQRGDGVYFHGQYLLYETSRRCKWSKCIFCCFINDYKNIPYREKNPSKVANDIKEISKSTGNEQFYFVNDYMPADYAKKLSIEIIKRDLKIKWHTYIMFENSLDYNTLKLMKKAGCRWLSAGLESGNQNINNKIRKGISLKVANRIIKDCQNLKLDLQLFTMVGFPMETLGDMTDTLRFIHKNRKRISKARINFFTPISNTIMSELPYKYNLRLEKGGIIRFSKTTILKRNIFHCICKLYQCYNHFTNIKYDKIRTIQIMKKSKNAIY